VGRSYLISNRFFGHFSRQLSGARGSKVDVSQIVDFMNHD